MTVQQIATDQQFDILTDISSSSNEVGWGWVGGWWWWCKNNILIIFFEVPFFPSADPASKQPVLVSAITLPKN